MITLGDIRLEASEIVSGGVCESDPRVARAVNLATERLFYLVRGQHGQETEVTLPACGCYFSLDYRYERILGKSVQAAGRPIPIFGQGYERLERGPGEVSCNDCMPGLIAEGHRPAMHPVNNMRILILTDSPQDEGGVVNVQGTDSANREVVRGKRGEDILISNKSPRYSVTEFRGELTAVTKPVTKGWVYGYAFNPEDNFKQLLFAMHPLQTSSDYYRYKAVGLSDCDQIVANVLKKWYAVVADTDVLPIQSASAILDKLRAMEARKNKDAQTEAINNNSAKSQLEARTEYADDAPAGLDIRVSDAYFQSHGDVW